MKEFKLVLSIPLEKLNREVDVEGRQACSKKNEVRNAHKGFIRKLQRKS